MKFLLNRSALFLVFFAIIISVTLTVTRILLIEYGYAKIALLTFPLSIIPIVMIAIPIGRVIKFLFQISKLVLGKIFNNKNYDKVEKIGIKAFNYSNTKIKESKKKSNKNKTSDIFWLAPIIVLVIALLPMPIGYFMLSRTVVFICVIYYGYNYYKNKDQIKPWIFGFFAVLYNPIAPIYLQEKLIWVIVNIITIYYIYKNK